MWCITEAHPKLRHMIQQTTTQQDPEDQLHFFHFFVIETWIVPKATASDENEIKNVVT